MARAVWNGAVLAETPRARVVEGNHYFPPDDVNAELLRPSAKETHCGWKGQASYYDIEVDGERLSDAAWYYAEPEPPAHAIKGHVAFVRHVDIEDTGRKGPFAALRRLFGS